MRNYADEISGSSQSNEEVKLLRFGEFPEGSKQVFVLALGRPWAEAFT